MADTIRVLYVDDETGLLEIGKLFLEESGDFSVTTITSAPAALELLEKEQYNAIISDYQMPDMDGIEFLIEVRARFGSIPFILFTGRGREEVVIQAINNGVDFYLQKGGELGSQYAELSHNIKSAALRKRAEEALRESERTFRVHIENSFDVIFTLNDESNFVFISPAWERHFGYPVSDVIGKSLMPFVHPDDIAPLVEYLKRVLTTGQSETSPAYRVRHANGRWLWFVANGTPYSNNKGERQFIGVGRDITERKVVEEELRLSEEKFRKAFFTSPNSICITRLNDGMFISINKGFTEITGYTEEDVIGKTSLEINIWKDPEDRRKIVEGLQANGEVRDYEASFLTKTGEIYGLMSTSIIELNGVPHILNITQDISDRKQAEEALQENEERYKYISEMTTDFVFSCIKPDGALYSINWMAGAVEQITGYTIDELLAMGCWRCIVHSDDASVFDENITNLPKGSSAVCILRILTKSGTERWLAVNTAHLPTKDSSAFSQVFGGCRDITERKRTELELISTQDRLKEAHRLAHIGIWDWVIETDTVTWSDELCSIAGWDPLLPAPTYAELPRVYTPASWVSLSGAVTRALTTGEPYNLELEMIRPDGNIRWTNAFGGVNRDREGKIIGLHGTVQDITQRKLEEEALRINENRLQMTQEIGHIGCWEYDIKTNQMWGSEEGCYLFGYPRVAVSFPVENFASCITEPELVLKAFNDLIMEGKEYDLNFVINPKDGSAQKTLHSIGRLEKDEQGNPVKVKGINQDITERKAAEEALRQSENRYSTIYNQSPIAIELYDAAGILVHANNACLKLFGIENIHAIRNFSLFADPNINGEQKENLLEGKTVHYQGPFDFEKVKTLNLYPTSRKGIIWLDVLITPLVESVDSKTGFLVQIKDITERKRVEVTLQETNEYLNKLINYASAPIIVWDPDFRIIRFNHAFEDLTLKSDQEVIGQPLEILFPKESKETSLIQIKKTLEGERWESVEIPILAKDGSVRTILWNSANILDSEGMIISTIAQGVDITKRKKADAALKELFATFKTVMDSLDALVYVADMKTFEILFVNEYGRKIWGDLTGKTCWKALQMDQNGPCPFCTNEKLLDPDRNPAEILIWEFQNTITKQWYECHDSAIRWIDNRIVRLEIATNITERKCVEEKLFETEQRLGDIIDFLPDATFAIDSEGKVIAWNHAIEEMTGIQSVDMLGKEYYEYSLPFYGERRPILIDFAIMPDPLMEFPHYSNVRREGDTITAETTLAYLGGKNLYLWCKSIPLKNNEGKIVGAIESIRDISDHKTAEDLLKESRKKYKELVESISDVIYEIDSHGIITYITPSVRNILEFESEEIIGRNFIDLIYSEDRDLLLNRFSEITKGIEYPLDYRVLTKSGEVRWVRSLTKPVTKSNTFFRGRGTLIDITDRKLMEEALKISQFQLSEAMNLAHMANWQFDVNSGIFTFDDSFYSLYGTNAEFEGGYEMTAEMYANKFVHPDDLHTVADEVNKAIEATDPAYESKLVHRIIRRDGEIRHIIVLIGITKDENGKTIKTHGVNQDISESKQMEETIRENEEKFRTVADFTYDWEFWITPDGNYKYVSPSCERITGYRPLEFILDSDLLMKIVHNDDRDKIVNHFSSLQEYHRDNDSLEYRIIARNGEERWIGHECQQVYNTDGDYIGIRGSNRDITERKRAERNLVSTLKRTQNQQAVLAMISLSPHLFSGDVDALSVILTQVSSGVLGVERVSVWLFNKKEDELRCIDLFEKLEDRHSRDLVLKRHEYVNEFDELSKANFIDAHDPLTDPRTAGYVEGYLKPNRITSMLDAVIRVSGQNLGVICFEHVDRPHHWESDEIAFACQLADQIAITLLNHDRKEAEDALQQANRKLNLLSGVTRHDIKNKVMTIQGFLRFARKTKDIDEVQSFLDKIQDSAKAIEHQIDFSKNYQDLGAKLPKWLNLSNMIILAGNPAINIFDETGTLQIFADPLFEKVLYNLTDNTIRHGDTATEAHVSVITEQDDIRIIWTDNGVGVPADQKEIIFNRGFGKNTGLGLFLIREILAITGMSIQETGEPGKGARFEITVPNGKWRYGSEAN